MIDKEIFNGTISAAGFSKGFKLGAGIWSIFVQLEWDAGGTVDDATVAIQAKANESMGYTSMSVNNNGTIETISTLSVNSAGSHVIQFDTWVAPYVNISFGAGSNTSGELVARIYAEKKAEPVR